jgi:hypothetical protein
MNLRLLADWPGSVSRSLVLHRLPAQKAARLRSMQLGQKEPKTILPVARALAPGV